MGDVHHVSVWSSLRILFEDGTVTGLTDAQLLELFAARRDQAAFTALVERHGPMVHRVCHEVLRNDHGAQDAFQATFLVLAHGDVLDKTAARLVGEEVPKNGKHRQPSRSTASKSWNGLPFAPPDPNAILASGFCPELSGGGSPGRLPSKS